MNPFITLTGPGNENIYVNVNNILYFIEYPKETGLFFSNQKAISVKNPPHDIIAKIKAASK
jgi:hypothetical protein